MNCGPPTDLPAPIPCSPAQGSQRRRTPRCFREIRWDVRSHCSASLFLSAAIDLSYSRHEPFWLDFSPLEPDPCWANPLGRAKTLVSNVPPSRSLFSSMSMGQSSPAQGLSRGGGDRRDQRSFFVFGCNGPASRWSARVSNRAELVFRFTDSDLRFVGPDDPA